MQLGLRGAIRDEYAAGSQILSIEDITPFVSEMRERAGSEHAASDWSSLLVPEERVVRLSEELRLHIGADEVPPG